MKEIFFFVKVNAASLSTFLFHRKILEHNELSIKGKVRRFSVKIFSEIFLTLREHSGLKQKHNPAESVEANGTTQLNMYTSVQQSINTAVQNCWSQSQADIPDDNVTLGRGYDQEHFS